MSSNAKKRIVRIATYGSLLMAAFGTAYIYGLTLKTQERATALQVLKREINSHWGLTKLEIDMVNESAQSFIERRGLKPGEPLPPKELAKESPPLNDMLKKMKSPYYIQSFPAVSDGYSTKATAIVTISTKVPREGEKYAYGAIEHSYEIFGSVYSIYPNDEYGVARITRALKAYAKTLKNEGN
jgi:hypothetical protein